MLILNGYSEERSTYCQKTSFLRIYGWILSPTVDKIVFVNNDEELFDLKINIKKEDIWISYKKVGNSVCGWEYEGKIPITLNLDTLYLYFYKNEKIIFKQKIEVFYNPDKENYLSTFKYIDTKDMFFSPNDILKEFEKISQDVRIYDFIEDDYFEWFNKVDYLSYPKYCKEFKVGKILHCKALQHYLSIKLLDIQKDDVYLDIASSNSVCPDIIEKFYTKNIFRQDLLYKDGVHNNLIGSNAEDIPLLDKTVDKITLHCSFEHFENNSDINFLKEAHRILKEKGKIVITPFYMNEKEHILTSPSIWESKYSIGNLPKFTKNYPLVVDENIKQRQEKVFSVDTLVSEIIKPFEKYFMFEIIHLEEIKSESLSLYPQFTLLCSKI